MPASFRQFHSTLNINSNQCKYRLHSLQKIQSFTIVINKFPLNSASIYALTSRSISFNSMIYRSTFKQTISTSSTFKHSFRTDKRKFSVLGNYRVRSILRYTGYWSPRLAILIWGVSFIGAGLYLLKKSIDSDGFQASFSPGTGGDIAKEDWTLIDYDGNIFEKKDFDGKYSLIYFGFTFCPDVCPVEMTKLGEIADILKERGIGLDVLQPVFVSVDYKRDTPELIKDYIKQFTNGNDKKILGLCGTRQQMEHFAKVMKTYFSDPPQLQEDYILEHSTYMYFLGNGEFKNLTNTEDGSEVLANKICLWIAEDNGKVAKITEHLKQIFR